MKVEDSMRQLNMNGLWKTGALDIHYVSMASRGGYLARRSVVLHQRMLVLLYSAL